ncbi:MAG: hypothetical protein PUJ71_04595, partial [Clostridiales bacterium]|nr:hypothetical protein [Clostridiales bacterium]
AHGYRVSAPELIDPEETPKNIMLRGIREQNPSQARMEAADRDIADDTDKGSTRRLVTAVLLLGAIAAFGVYAAALLSRHDRQKASPPDDKQ